MFFVTSIKFFFRNFAVTVCVHHIKMFSHAVALEWALSTSDKKQNHWQ